MAEQMTTDTTQEVRAHMRRLGITQDDLGRRLGMEQGNVSRLLSTPVVSRSSRWLEVLDILGLEVVVRPRQQANG